VKIFPLGVLGGELKVDSKCWVRWGFGNFVFVEGLIIVRFGADCRHGVEADLVKDEINAFWDKFFSRNFVSL
jgi:hypothetical protein